MKLEITTKSEVPGFSGHFATIDIENEDDITMDNCRNVVAKELAIKAFRDGKSHSYGMWTVIPQEDR